MFPRCCNTISILTFLAIWIQKQRVKVVTEEDLEKYTIFDVVLPQPGYDVTYPANATFAEYEKIMGE